MIDTNCTALIAKIQEEGKSIKELAEIIGVTRQALYSKLNGEREFKLSEVGKLATALHMTDCEKNAIFFADYVG